MPPDHTSLQAQAAWLMQRMGKALHFLRDKIDPARVPAPNLLGV